MNVENILLSEIRQTQKEKTLYDLTYSRIGIRKMQESRQNFDYQVSV
jgi:hypothetical protein